MLFDNYIICGYRELVAMVDDPQRPLDKIDTIISIVPSFGGFDACHDVAARGYKAKQHFFGFLDHYDPTLTGAPSLDDAQQAVAIAQSLQGGVLAQCFAGKSRSSGMMDIVLNYIAGTGHEHAILNSMVAHRSKIIPSAILTMYGDYVLGRNGAMMEAILARDDFKPKYAAWYQSVGGHKSDAEERHRLEFPENDRANAPEKYVRDPSRIPDDVRASRAFGLFREWVTLYAPEVNLD